MGPSHPLTPRDDGSYQFTLIGWPGNVWDFSYGYGGELYDAESTPRSVILGDTDSVVEHVITGWDGLAARADLTEGATTQVLIRLSVSAEDEGVPAPVRALCDVRVCVPMEGFVPSYSVQAPVAAVAVERLRQRAVGRGL